MCFMSSKIRWGLVEHMPVGHTITPMLVSNLLRQLGSLLCSKARAYGETGSSKLEEEGTVVPRYLIL